MNKSKVARFWAHPVDCNLSGVKFGSDLHYRLNKMFTKFTLSAV